MRGIILVVALGGCLIAAACNTVRGAGEDAKSVGRVFSHDPDHK